MKIKKFIVFLFAGTILFASLPVFAGAPALEYQVKAAFLFNFMKFVEWPPETFTDPATPMIIGVLGENPFGDTLHKTIQDQKLSGRPIEIKHSSNVEDLKTCQLLFISQSEENSVNEILDRLRGLGILTIGETENFVGEGGMIQFIEKENKVRFQINQEAAKAVRLKINSRLLALAERG